MCSQLVREITAGSRNLSVMVNKNKFFPVLNKKNESGFSLIEVTIALVILLISILAVFTAFTYSIIYNAGNSSRSQGLSVFQKEIELLRSAKFTPTIYNDPLLTGGKKTPIYKTSEGDNTRYLLETTVDNDPYTAGIQSTGNDTTKLKEITITVTPQNTNNGKWVSAYKTTIIMHRTRAN